MQPKDLVGMLLKLQAGDVLFIDEIHRLPAPVEEFLYSAMEDFHVDVTIDSGLHATTESFKLQPFTLVGRDHPGRELDFRPPQSVRPRPPHDAVRQRWTSRHFGRRC